EERGFDTVSREHVQYLRGERWKRPIVKSKDDLLLLTDGKSPIPSSIPRLVWSGDVPHQKWMNFYTKVLSKFAATTGLKLTLRVEVAPTEGVSLQKVDETKVALRELGLKDSIESE